MGETVKAGMRNGMECGMEWNTEWGNVKKYDKSMLVLCIRCQQVADTLPYTKQTKKQVSYHSRTFCVHLNSSLIIIHTYRLSIADR